MNVFAFQTVTAVVKLEIKKFLRHSCLKNIIEMSDGHPDAPDQSHLLDDTTIPLVDIASSVNSNEEEVIVEAGNDLEKDRENEEAVSTTTDHSPAMVMTMMPVEDEGEEVIDLSSDEENEDPVISGIFQTHIQPKLTTKTSQKWLNETMGGLNVLSKAIKKGKIQINRSPSPKKSSAEKGPSEGKLSPSDLRLRALLAPCHKLAETT